MAPQSPLRIGYGTPISQYASYSALLCSLHSSISKEQHANEKYPCNPSSHNRKYEVKRMHQRLIIGKPRSQYASYSAMVCPLYNNMSKEQHEKHLCNPSSHYRKYGEYSRETRASYLNM